MIPGYRLWRKWPGVGSRAFGWLLRESVADRVVWRRWCGRAGGLTLRSACGALLFLVGMHGAHGDDWDRSLCDARALLRHKPRGAPWLLCRDVNCDHLPESSLDPFAERPGRDERHSWRRSLLRQMLDEESGSVVEPEQIFGSPMSAFADAHGLAPITRVPRSTYHEVHKIPSQIDHLCCSDVHLISEHVIDWRAAISDHSVLHALCRWPCLPEKRSPLIWQPESWTQVDVLVEANDLSTILVGEPAAQYQRLRDHVRVICERTQTQSCKNQRRLDRLP